MMHEEEKKAKKVLIRLLARKSWFSHELFQNLSRKGFNPDVIKKLIAEAKASGYIHDEELALRFIKSQQERGYGRRLIVQKLRLRAGNLTLPDTKETNPVESILKLLERRYAKQLASKKRNQVIASLVRKGFELNDIFEALAFNKACDGSTTHSLETFSE